MLGVFSFHFCQSPIFSLLFWILQVCIHRGIVFCQSPIVFQGKSRKQHRDETSLTKVVDDNFEVASCAVRTPKAGGFGCTSRIDVAWRNLDRPGQAPGPPPFRYDGWGGCRGRIPPKLRRWARSHRVNMGESCSTPNRWYFYCTIEVSGRASRRWREATVKRTPGHRDDGDGSSNGLGDSSSGRLPCFMGKMLGFTPQLTASSATPAGDRDREKASARPP